MASKKVERKIKHRSAAASIIKLEKAGDTFSGTFKGLQVKDLYSPKTKSTSATRMYNFVTDDGERVILTGRAMLDDQFDEMAMEAAQSTLEEPGGVEALRGEYFKITRNVDIKTAGGNSLGSYIVEWLEELTY
jgi:hypothetical protein